MPHAKTLIQVPEEKQVKRKISKWIAVRLAAIILRTRRELAILAKKKIFEKRYQIEVKRLIRRREQEGQKSISKDILVAYRVKAIPVLAKLDRAMANLRSFVENNAIIHPETGKLTAKDIDTLVDIDEAMDNLTKLRIARGKLDLTKPLTVDTIKTQVQAIQTLLNDISKTSSTD